MTETARQRADRLRRELEAAEAEATAEAGTNTHAAIAAQFDNLRAPAGTPRRRLLDRLAAEAGEKDTDK